MGPVAPAASDTLMLQCSDAHVDADACFGLLPDHENKHTHTQKDTPHQTFIRDILCFWLTEKSLFTLACMNVKNLNKKVKPSVLGYN